jgi:hypothetical protein
VKVGDVVYCEGASALHGDVVSVDEVEGTAEVRWRSAYSTESFEDLILVESASAALPTLATLSELYPGLKAWSRERYVGNECDTDEYGETQPAKGLVICAAFLDAPDHPEGLLLLVQRWVAALGGRYDGADQLEPILNEYHDWLWERGSHPYDTERPGDYFDLETMDEYREDGGS